VLHPLRVIIDNFPEGQVEWLEAENNPENPDMGTRLVPFAREIFIEQEDFMENPPKKYFRLSPGVEIRLKSAYIIKCEQVVKDGNGSIVEVHCSYDPESRSGGATSGRKIKGTSHWVAADHSAPAKVRIYEHLFTTENPDGYDGEADYKTQLNPHSEQVLEECRIEPSLAAALPGSRFQFLRQGYFFLDPEESKPGQPVFNRIVSLRDTWAKILKGS